MRQLATAMSAALLAAAIAACPPPDTSAPVPPAQLDVTPPAPVQTDASPPAAADAGPRPAPGRRKAQVGAHCNDNGDCTSGVCEGVGCDLGEGVCAPASRPCTRDLRPYCGCDGETFQSSGRCPGRRYAYRGSCSAPRADGAACASDLQCQSGICEGLGCGDDESGRCVPTGRMCTADVKQYCGCNGKTFTASGSCPGRRYAGAGACK